MIRETERKQKEISNDPFCQMVQKRIDLLNQEFFQNIELTKQENQVLIWLCRWDEETINAIISAVKKLL
jgi:hypothetical protein